MAKHKCMTVSLNRVRHDIAPYFTIFAKKIPLEYIAKAVEPLLTATIAKMKNMLFDCNPPVGYDDTTMLWVAAFQSKGLRGQHDCTLA